jgi:hypothetical protein
LEFSKCLNFPFAVFVVAGCIVYVLDVVVSFIVVFLYCVCALFVCTVCYLSVVLLYYCHRAEAQLQFNIYIYRERERERNYILAKQNCMIDANVALKLNVLVISSQRASVASCS